MSDIIDEAAAREEDNRQRALGQRKPNGPAATGRCLNIECEATLPPGVRWCNAGCRDRYTRVLQFTLAKRARFYDE